MNILYLKHHGLPGIAQTKGLNGVDGNNGNNVYFGYISDFFGHVEISVENFIRTAQKNTSSDYYTGVYSNLSTPSTDIVSTPSTKKRDKDISYYRTDVSTYNVTDTNNQFLFIYDEPNDFMKGYSYSYEKFPKKEDDKSSQTYIKVASGDSSMGGYNSDSTTKDASLWWGDYNDDSHASYSLIDVESWPYVQFYGTKDSGDAIDIMTGKSSISKINGFELFTTSSDSKYIYKSDNERYNDFRYSAYNNTQTLSSGSVTDVKGDNGILMKTSYLEYLAHQYSHIDPTYSNVPNYVKYAHKAIETVLVTDKLSSDIKAGDVIYFYTDPEIFNMENAVEYMIVITKSLENCVLDDLIAAASVVNPLTFKYVDTTAVKGTEFLSTYNRACSVYYKDANANIVEQCGKNFCNLLTYGSDSALNVGNISENTNNENKTLILKADSNDLSFSTKISDTNIKNVISSESGSKIKLSNAYAKKFNIGNIETEKCVSPNHINLDSMYHCYTISEKDYDYSKNLITIDSSDIVDSDAFNDYECGVIIITYDYSKYADEKTFIDGQNCVIKKYTFVSHTDMNFTIDKQYGYNTAHNILLWVSTTNGMKYYSYHSLVTYDYSIRNYTFEVIEDNNNVVEEKSSEDDVLVYTPAGITADKVENGSLKIELPNTATNIHLYINSEELSEGNTYSNTWCSLTRGENINDVEQGTHIGTEPTVIPITVSMEDNIPQMTTYNNISNARNYVASPGQTNDETSGCELFNMILKDQAVSTKDRSVTVTVKYDYQKYGVKHQAKSFYKLTQPGYVENRKIPKVELSIDSDLNSLEMANNIDNGVLCNQFQFFLNVNISDFDKTAWSSYVDENNISLNLQIKNIPVDYESVEKYAILSAESMYTYHAFAKDVNNDLSTSANNYLRLNVYPVDSSIENPYNSTQRDLYPNISFDSSNTTKQTKYTYNSGNIEVIQNFSTDTKAKDTNTIIMLPRFFNNENPEKATRGTGINDSVTINIKNIKFSDIENSPLRFRVFVEVGNPIFSKLFFRYYVSNMYVTYKDSSVSNDDIKFYIGTNNLSTVTLTGRLQTYDYMFASDTFNAFICPLSLTAILNKDIANVTGENIGKLSGSDDLIDLSLSAYIPQISSKTEIEKVEALINNQYIDWFNFSLKKKYLQDNVKSFYVQPIHISDYYDKISKDDMFITMNRTTDYEQAYNNVKSDVLSNAYLSVVYNAYTYYQKITYDIPQFYYNDKLYKSSKYNQLHNNSPVFLTLSIAYDVRGSLLINSMDMWNYQYKVIGNTKHSGVFTGHVNSYGNGYQYINSDYDTSESTDTQLSLALTKEQNEYSFFDAPYSQNTAQLSKSSDDYPNVGKWFRTLLWQLKWQYAKYYTDSVTQIQKVEAYDIVDSGRYTYSYNPTLEANKYMIPHNLTYSLYPRCAYDSDNNTNIIFMLRCPTICNENQYKMNKTPDIKFTIDESSYNSNQLSHSGLTSLI